MIERYRTERDVDAAIDRAVREIMSAEPRPGFKHRVLRRLHEGPAQRWTLARLATLATATAASLLALWLLSPRSPQAPDTRVATQHAPAPVTRPAPGPDAPRPEPPVRSAPPARTAVPSPPPVLRQPPPGRVEAASIVVEDVRSEPAIAAMPALAELDPIRIAPLLTEPLRLRELSIPALTIEPITIAPLSPPR